MAGTIIIVPLQEGLVFINTLHFRISFGTFYVSNIRAALGDKETMSLSNLEIVMAKGKHNRKNALRED